MLIRFIPKIKGAALMAALFFASTAWAGEKTETYKDLIEKDVACCDNAGLSETAFPAA
jgi:hypothetical protein